MSCFLQGQLLVAKEEPNTLMVDVEALYKWSKLSGNCFCSKICMLYCLVTSLFFSAHAVTATIRN